MYKYFIPLLLSCAIWACQSDHSQQDSQTGSQQIVQSNLSSTPDVTIQKDTTPRPEVTEKGITLATDEKVLDLLNELPEVITANNYIDSLTNHKKGISLMIGKKPTADNPFFQIRAGYNGPEQFEPYYNFYVNALTLKIEVDDVVEGKRLDLAEWRKLRKKRGF